jgi:hypothetical protein
MQSLSKFQWHFFFTEIEKNNPKICLEAQKTSNSQSYFEQEEQSWRQTFPDFKIDYRAIVIKAVMVLPQQQTDI